MVSNNELCFNAQKGDENSVEILINKFNPLLISFMHKYQYDSYDDMMQDGREVIIRSIYEFDITKGKDFTGYVNMVLRHSFLEKIRKRHFDISLNTRCNNDDSDGDEIIDMIAGNELTPEDAFLKNMIYNNIKEAIDKLTEKQRKIIKMYFYDDISMADISRKIGVNYQGVVKLKNRAIKKLKSEIKFHKELSQNGSKK